MSTLDSMRAARQMWERNHYKRLRDLGNEFPVESVERWSRKRAAMVDYGCPKVRLLCARMGHNLVTVTRGVDVGTVYPVRSVEGDGRSERAGMPVAFDAFWSPEGQPRANNVCAIHGCGILTQGLHCVNHATTPEEFTHTEGNYTLRVTLVCPHRGCTYRGTKHMETLYKLYYTAVRHAWTEIRLPD